MGDLPNAVVKRLLGKHSEGLRVSGAALERAVLAAEEYIARLAHEAQASALAERRKTIMDGDIDKARAKIG
ncbi:MAG: histone-like protein [Myxococcota bacterium]